MSINPFGLLFAIIEGCIICYIVYTSDKMKDGHLMAKNHFIHHMFHA